MADDKVREALEAVIDAWDEWPPEKFVTGKFSAVLANARAVLSTPPPADDGVRIPREPTEKMMAAGARSIIDGDARPGTSWAEEAGLAWRAMYDAALNQTKEEGKP